MWVSADYCSSDHSSPYAFPSASALFSRLSDVVPLDLTVELLSGEGLKSFLIAGFAEVSMLPSLSYDAEHSDVQWLLRLQRLQCFLSPFGAGVSSSGFLGLLVRVDLALRRGFLFPGGLSASDGRCLCPERVGTVKLLVRFKSLRICSARFATASMALRVIGF